jgi:hypothetical protein
MAIRFEVGQSWWRPCCSPSSSHGPGPWTVSMSGRPDVSGMSRSGWVGRASARQPGAAARVACGHIARDCGRRQQRLASPAASRAL